MNESIFQIGAKGVDVDRIVEDIRATVADKMQKGVYADPRVARAERVNLARLRNEEDLVAFYLDCLRGAVFVDINDFEIQERRAHLSGVLVGMKRLLWKLLKFYTYRLWSQQNQVNGMLLAALEATENRHRERMNALEQRLAALERRPGGGQPA